MPDTPRGRHAEDHIGGVSPNWYCSGGGEEGLRQELAVLIERVARLEAQLKEKDAELDEAQQALREERQLEVESLSSMKSGSERILEQKSQQVQQLHGAIRKLNEALRKKDQQLAAIVSHNLRADGAFTETAADLSEARLNLKHAEADLSKERVTLQRLEAQMQSVTQQNQRLDELVMQYRHEVQKKDHVINSHILKEESLERQKNSAAMEVGDSLSDAAANINRLDNELSAQESSLLAGFGLHARCTPSIVRPGQRVKVAIQSRSAKIPTLVSISNAHDLSDIRSVSQAEQEWLFEASFTAGVREGSAVLTLSVQGDSGVDVSAQAVALVEGTSSALNLSGTTFAPRPSRCHLMHDMEVLITPRNATGELVGATFTSDVCRPTSGKSVSPPRSPEAVPLDVAPTVAPVVQVAGASIVTHVEKLSQHTHRIVVRPTNSKVDLVIADSTGVLASATFLAESPKPDLSRTQLEAPARMTVGDRGTAKVHLFDAKGFPCPAPSPSELIRPSTGLSSEGDATDLGDEILELGYGVYGFHFVPLAVGTTTLNVALGEEARRTARTSVTRAGGAASASKFDVVLDPPAGCVPHGGEVRCNIVFSDAAGLPATAAPTPSSVSVEVSDAGVFKASGVVPDPSSPGALTCVFSSLRSGSAEVSITCTEGTLHKSFTLWSTGGAQTGGYHDMLVSVTPTRLPPGGMFEVVATPVDAAGNTVAEFPRDVHLPSVAIADYDRMLDLKRRHGGHASVQVPAPLTPGVYVVSVDTRRLCIEVSTDMLVASHHINTRVRGVVSRLPGMLHSMELREAAVRALKTDLSEAHLECKRLRVRNSELNKLHEEELRSQYDTACLERDNMGSRVAELKNKLSAERSEQRQLQQRWDSREESIEEERRQRAEDRRQWLDERARLTQLDEENTSTITHLRQQVSDMQTRIKSLNQAAQRRMSEQAEEMRLTAESDRKRWEAERASLETRYVTAMERADEYRVEAETERNRVEQHTLKIDEMDQTISSMKLTLGDINVQRQRLETQLRRVDEERTEVVIVNERKVEEQTRIHQHSITIIKQSHAEELAQLRQDLAAQAEEAEERVKAMAAEMETKRSAAVAQVQSAKLQLMHEKEELQQSVEELEAKLRANQREVHSHQEEHEVAARMWETEKRSLERRIEESKQTAREADQRAAADIETTRALVEHDRASWKTEKRALAERVTLLQDDMTELQRQQDLELSTERAAFEKERQQWERERGDVVASHAKQRDRHDEAVRQLNRLLEEEKFVIDDERRQWIGERTDLKGRINDLQLQLDEALRQGTRVSDEMLQEVAMEREEWVTRQVSLESEIQEIRSTAAEAAARSKRDMQAAKGQYELQTKELAAEVDRLEQALEGRDEELATEKRRAAREMQVLREDFEVEREKYKMKCTSLRQEIENCQAEIEEAHARHALKTDEMDQERQKWSQESTLLREKLVQLEQGAAELAQDHKAQVADHDKLIAKVKKEAEASFQTRASQLEASYMQRLDQEIRAVEEKHAEAAAEWEAEQLRLAETHRNELLRLQNTSVEGEKMAEKLLQNARENFNSEIARYEAQVTKLQAEKAAARQRAEADRAEERQRLRQEHQQLIEGQETERKEWECERDRLLQAQDEMKAASQREINSLNRQLQRAGLDQAEAQEEEARKEMAALREVWQQQLAAVTEAHENDRSSFAKEREEWRGERAKLWGDRNAAKQAQESAVAETCAVREDAEMNATQQAEEIARLVDRISILESDLEAAARRMDSRTTTDHSLLDTERDEWRSEKDSLVEQMDSLRTSLEHQQNEKRRMQQEMEELMRQSDVERAGTVQRLQQRHGELVEELDTSRSAAQKLQKEVTRLTIENEEVRKRLTESAGQTQAEIEAQRQVTETALATVRLERDEMLSEVTVSKQKVVELEAALERAGAAVTREKQHHVEEYEQLRERHAKLERQYTEQLERNAKESQEFRELSSELEVRWLEKEASWAKSLEEARQRAGQDASEFDEKLDSAIQSMDDQMKERTAELRRAREEVHAAQALAGRAQREKDDVETWLRNKLDTDKQTWDAERQRLSQQLEIQKRRLEEVQDQRQGTDHDMSRERSSWGAERSQLREEAAALRKKLTDMENTLVEQMDQHAAQMMEMEAHTQRNDVDVSGFETKATAMESEVQDMQRKQRVLMEEKRQCAEDLALQRAERERLSQRLLEVEEESSRQLISVQRSHTTEVVMLKGELDEARRSITVEQDRSMQSKQSTHERVAEVTRTAAHLQEEKLRWEAERAELLEQIEELQKAHSMSRSPEQDNLSRGRESWDTERRDLHDRDDFQGSDDLHRNGRKSDSPLRSNDAERIILQKEIERLNAKCRQAELDRVQVSEEALATKEEWQQEKAEFDTFLQELDSEKQRDKRDKRRLEDENEVLKRELTRLTVQDDEEDLSRHTGLSNPSPPTPRPLSPASLPPSAPQGSISPVKGPQSLYSAYRAATPQLLEEVRDALLNEYGTIGAALSSMTHSGELTEDGVRNALLVIGMPEAADAIIAAALEEARGGRLAEGLQAILVNRPSQFETTLDQVDAFDRQAVERNRLIIEQRGVRAPVAVAASQVVAPSVTVTKVQTTTTTTVRNNRARGAFPYFGVEVTDGVRVGNSKQEYLGVKIVKSKGAALQAGIQGGDILKEIHGSRVQSLDDFRSVMAALPTKVPLTVVVEREGQDMALTLKPQATNARPGSLSRYTQSIPVTALVPEPEVRPRSLSSDSNAMGRRPARFR
eukprot:TRINITY_DN14884_c1_g1_i2.p1 TRINITY_DN14884_c1_g1~~TRINITY_DN14884_c1_g1_i2.p1  ORF type:complete len:2757 (+),score=1197.49 TRINITY_DN14884_c1_g1_i2:63-8333(+)